MIKIRTKQTSILNSDVLLSHTDSLYFFYMLLYLLFIEMKRAISNNVNNDNKK